jgi:hypothetical protein
MLKSGVRAVAEREDIAKKMEATAHALLGDPNARNRRGKEWRYGNKGSLAIDLSKGTWFDYEAGEGGGVLDLIKREIGGDTRRALEWLERETGNYVPTVKLASKSDAEKERSNLRDAALRIWREAVPAAGTLAQHYLSNRRVGFGAQFDDVRFHGNCPFGKDAAGQNQKMPCMVVLVRDPGTRDPIGIHRTAISPEGRKLDRKMLGPCHGGVAMLGNHSPDADLAIAEGIETSLSAAKLFKRPVWATLTAGTMKSFHPIGGVSGLIIFSDNDSAGIAAAQDCAAHWRPIQVPVSIQAPTVEGWDYSNALEAFERGEISA